MPEFKSPAEPVVPRIGAIYRHYKGAEYVVKDIDRDSETKVLRVSYTDDITQPGWSRVMVGIGPDGKPCGWGDVTEDGMRRFTPVKVLDV